MNPEEARRLLARIAGEAAGFLRDNSCTEAFSKSLGGETIRADVASEEYIIETIRLEGIQYPIVTEERGYVDGSDREYVILVDPLDGSKNYSNCIPWSSVSLALLEVNGDWAVPVAGAVAPVFYGPILSFAKGDGCRVGGRRVENRIVSEKFIYVYIEEPEAAQVLASLIARMGGGYKIRSLGSAALELAYVALGRGTAFIDLRSKLRNVDVAAAMGMILECGGRILTPQGPLDRLRAWKVERLGSIAAVHKPGLASLVEEVLWGRSAAPATDHRP